MGIVSGTDSKSRLRQNNNSPVTQDHSDVQADVSIAGISTNTSE